MSDYTVIGAVDTTLRTLLWSQMQHDSGITAIIGTEQRISLDPPFELVRDTNPRENYLSLFLYRILENGEMKNRPFEPKDTNLLRPPPLSLDLLYLITPLTNSAENDHKLLGKTMQVLYDNGIVKGPALQGVLQGTAEELRIILDPISLEDFTKLWSAFMRSCRLSVTYKVKVIYIDSERETEAERVRRKKIEYGESTGA